ncbi:FtsX-like permease family protein, partial [uncultured Duncaniella sp.]
EKNEIMSRDMNNQDFISMSIALFFFVNILLCMVGTFYLQTRKRSEETGVMRTFGASRGFIVREMLGEGFVITTLAWIFGCFLYWLYIKDESLAQLAYSFSDAPSSILRQMTPTWIDDFTIHFSVVSLIIYSIMLTCVLLGIYIPAGKIARINPVDALRDE